MPDEFGGIPVTEDEFGGVLVDEESPSPTVIRDVPRGTLEPTDLFPGIRKMGGEIVPGQLGDKHEDIIDRKGIEAKDIDQRVFVTPWGDVLDREGAAQAVFPKAVPKFELGRLHSSDLSAAQKPGGLAKQLEQVGEEAAGPPAEESIIHTPDIPMPKEVPVSPGERIAQQLAMPELTQAIGPEAVATLTRETYNLAKSVPEFFTSLPGLAAMAGGRMFPTATAGFFTADMLKSLGNQLYDTYKNWGSMSFEDKVKAFVDAAATTAMTFGTAKATSEGIRSKIKPKAPPTERPGEAPLAAPTEGKAEVGEVVQAAPTEPAISETKPVGEIVQEPVAPAKKRTLTPAVREDANPDVVEVSGSHGGATLQHARKGNIAFLEQNKGFIDENGNWLSREEAAQRFKELTGKEPSDPNRLTSEDLKGFEDLMDLNQKYAPKAKTSDEIAQDAAKEIGFTLSPEKQIGSMKLAGFTEEQLAKLKAAGKTPEYEFTDRRPDSPTKGVTFYVPEGATKQQIIDAYKAKVAEFEKAKTPISIGPKPVPPIELVEDATEFIKSANDSKRPPKDASEALERYKRNTAVGRSRGEEFISDEEFASLWKLFKKPAEAKTPAAPTESTTVAAPTPEPIRAGTGAEVPTKKPFTSTIKFETYDEPSGKWEPQSRKIVVSKSTIPGDKPWRATVFAGPSDSPVPIAHIQLDTPMDVYGKAAIDELSGQLGRYTRKIDIAQRTEPMRPGPGAAVPSAKPSVAEPINLEMELGAGISLKGVSDAVKASVEYLKSLRNEELKAPNMNDRRRAVLNWSAKLQRSYGEAFSKQRDIIKAVPNQTRREGITNWIQADGDRTVLQDRYNATTDPKLKAGYKAAINLTPEEIAIANSVKSDYANFAARGQSAGVLDNLKDNYVTQTWDLGRGPGGLGAGRTLKEKFRFSKARTFNSFFEGEQAGYTPKTKDIAKLLPMYSHEMNSVIAAREMVAEMGNGVASDGRPLLAPKGVGIPVDSAEGGKATLVIPKAGKVDTSDYKVLPNQPALSGWKWVAKDDAGNPVFLKADLTVHPEAFAYLKNVLGRSAIRDWYGTRTTALAELPKILVKGIDMANSETKRTMLGMLATFHQIQTGTHAVGHRVNPFFSIPKIDLVNNKVQMDAAGHGLMMLPDRASMDQFMEGFRTSGLISKIPGIGPIADYYSHYLFHEYIPGLKFKTYEAILSRNQKVYAKDLAAGRVTPSDIKILSAEQANAAYGHLNYADLGRNPTVQHIAQIGLLAPDFLEARGRFAGQAIKGIAGAKVGREQLLALATLAIAQTAAAYVSAKLSGGDWDNKRPFEFVLGNRRYTVRSVPEDLVNLVTKTRQFIHSRLSPLVGKGLLQYLTGVDYRGQKVKASQTTKELAAQPLPLTIRGFTGLGNNTLSGMEQLAGSLGLRISRYSPSLDVYDMVKEFKKSSDDPKLQADIELQEKEVFSSVYDKLRTALRSGDLDAARKEYDAVKAIRTPKQIDNAMKPWTGGNLDVRTFQISPRKPKPFTGSAKTEKLFLKGLNPEQRTMYDKAVKERLEFYNTFKQMLAQPGSKETDEFGGIPVE